MARKNKNTPKIQGKKVKKEVWEGHYGTKKEMVVGVSNKKISEFINVDFDSNAVLAKDEKGKYITCESFVNANVLDPFRCYNRFYNESIDKSISIL